MQMFRSLLSAVTQKLFRNEFSADIGSTRRKYNRLASQRRAFKQTRVVLCLTPIDLRVLDRLPKCPNMGNAKAAGGVSPATNSKRS